MGYETGEAMERLADERDELAAELEQWKTNFSHAMDTANDIYEQKLEVLADLERVKAEHGWMKRYLVQIEILMELDDMLFTTDSSDPVDWIGEHQDPEKEADLYYEMWEKIESSLNEKVYEAKTELHSLKSRLPVNADGDVVLWGDTQFVPVGEKPEAVEFTAEVLGVDSFGNWYSMMSGEKVYLAGCHSTAESCRAANGGGE